MARLYGISEKDMERLQNVKNEAVVKFENNHYYYCIGSEAPIEIGMLCRK